jgi:hypothetical protein
MHFSIYYRIVLSLNYNSIKWINLKYKKKPFVQVAFGNKKVSCLS